MQSTDHRHIYPERPALYQAAAAFFVSRAVAAVAAHGRFAVALAGGSTPQPLYRLLARPPYREQIPWEAVHIFWGDERCVPPDHPDSNYRMVREALLDHVPIPDRHIFPIDGGAEPVLAAARYEQQLRNFFGTNPPAFDLIWLGLGDDAHTASLFPHTAVLQEQERWVADVFLPQKNTYRISLTAPLINQAAAIAFLVTGAGKAAAVKAVREGPYRPRERPAQLIQPATGALHWFLDGDAAGLT